MFVITLTRKRAFRAAIIILAVFIGIAVGIAAILTSINTGAAEAMLPIYSVDRADNKIALTFDCAWGNSNTDELLSILNEHGVFATFFVTGEFAEKYPEDVRRIAAAGHEIANHSDKHPHVKGMNINDLINDTREAERKITMLTGTKPTLYRSPYGEYDVNSIKTIEGLGYKFIQWSVDSIDWQEPDAATIVKRVTENTVAGSILLFHNDLENTAKALPEVLLRLRQAGFEFVKVSELIYYEDYFLDHAGKQIREVRTLLPVNHEPALAEAAEIIRSVLTYEEIASLASGVSPQIAAKVAPYLSAEQMSALSELTAAQASQILAAITGNNAPLAFENQENRENTGNTDNTGNIGNTDNANNAEYFSIHGLEPQKNGNFEDPLPQLNENNVSDLPDLPDLTEPLEEAAPNLNELNEGANNINELGEGADNISELNEGTNNANNAVENAVPNLNELLADDEEK